MPFDSNGTFNRVIPGGWKADAAANIKIRADRHDDEDDGFAQGLSNCITKDGRTQPTANIPMNNKRLITLGEPAVGSDAATKDYVDNFKSFTTGAIIAGADLNGRITFSSPTGANGLAWTGADLSWLARLAGAPAGTANRLVLNDKADGTGTDVIECREDGSISAATLVTAGAVTATSTVIIKGTTGNVHLWLQGPAGEDRMVLYTDAVTQGDATLRVGGTQNYTFGLNGTFSAGNLFTGGTTTSNVVVANGITSNGAINAGGGITAGGTITAPNSIISTAYFGTGLGAGTFVAFRSGTQRFYQFGSNIYMSHIEGDDTINFIMTTASLQLRNDKALLHNGQAYKPGGGSWAATSDARAKNVLGDYDRGLAAIKALHPVRFTYKGNDTWKPDSVSVNKGVADDGTEFVGFVAQEVEEVLPGVVRRSAGFIDGEAVDDLRTSDQSELIYALVNAVKELAAEVEVLKRVTR